LKKRAAKVIRDSLVLLFIGIAYYLFCKLTNLSLGCPLRSMTGLLCPGCGLTRMCFSLINLDIKGALYNNAGFFLLTPVFLIVAVSYNYNYIKSGSTSLTRWHKILLALCVVLLVCFGILRNIFDLGLRPPFMQ